MVSRNSDSMSLIDELDVLVDDRSTESEAFEPALHVNQYRNFDYCLISGLARKLLEWLSESLAHLGQARSKKKQKEPSSEIANKEESANKEVNRYLG